MNTLKTWLLMTVLTALIVLIGSAIGGSSGAVMALMFAAAMNGFSYFFSDKVALAMTQAREVNERSAPELHTTVRHLATRAGLPTPRVFVSPNPQPNAFATGRDPRHAMIVVNEGILHALTQRELEGVLAHEMSHVRNRDILIASLAATLAGAITWIAQIMRWGLFFGGGFVGGNNNRDQSWLADLALMILAPIAAVMIQLAISRSREYKADAGAAHLTRDPDALADALAKLDHAPRFGRRSGREADPAAAAAMAHLYIVNPLRGHQLASLFSTHPPTEERIRRLRLMRI
jgi:heat shock protein HtpX